MDKNTAAKKPHSLQIENRTKSSLSGIEKVVAASENQIILQTSEGGLTVFGNELKITKYDADSGNLAFCGTVNSIKYSAAKVSLAKKLFK